MLAVGLLKLIAIGLVLGLLLLFAITLATSPGTTATPCHQMLAMGLLLSLTISLYTSPGTTATFHHLHY